MDINNPSSVSIANAAWQVASRSLTTAGFLIEQQFAFASIPAATTLDARTALGGPYLIWITVGALAQIAEIQQTDGSHTITSLRVPAGQQGGHLCIGNENMGPSIKNNEASSAISYFAFAMGFKR